VNTAKSFADNLNAAEILVAYSSIDAIVASISMAFSDKAVLASRHVLYLGLTLQIGAFIIEGLVINRLSQFERSCRVQLRHGSLLGPMAITWTFYAIRIVVAFAPAWRFHQLASALDKHEHAPRESNQIKAARVWSSIPTTLFSNYLVHFSLFIVQAAPALSGLNAGGTSLSQSWMKLRSEWGQSAALIVASVAIAHVVYSFSRTFRKDAMETRISVCKANLDPLGWANPPLDWKISPPWLFLSQRSPFGKVGLLERDRLLVDSSPLADPDESPRTKKELDDLWGELLSAFEMNDLTYIKDCLKRGAPIDRRNGMGEYPMHMAARFGNPEVLIKTYGAHTDGAYDRLLAKNSSQQPPLEIAIQADKAEAAVYIIKTMAEEQRRHAIESGCNKSRSRGYEFSYIITDALERAITARQMHVTKILVENWAAWDSLPVSDGNPDLSFSTSGIMYWPFWSSVRVNDIRLAEFLISKIRDKNLLDDFVDGTPIDAFKPLETRHWTWFAMLLREIPVLAQHARQSGGEALFVQFLISSIINNPPGESEQTMNLKKEEERFVHTAEKDPILLSPGLIDWAFITFSAEISKEGLVDQGGQIKEILRHSGAKDWVEFSHAVERTDIAALERMLDAESETNSRERMVNAFGRHRQAPLLIAIHNSRKIHSADNVGTDHGLEDVQRVVELLLRSGAWVVFPDVNAELSGQLPTLHEIFSPLLLKRLWVSPLKLALSTKELPKSVWKLLLERGCDEDGKQTWPGDVLRQHCRFFDEVSNDALDDAVTSLLTVGLHYVYGLEMILEKVAPHDVSTTRAVLRYQIQEIAKGKGQEGETNPLQKKVESILSHGVLFLKHWEIFYKKSSSGDPAGGPRLKRDYFSSPLSDEDFWAAEEKAIQSGCEVMFEESLSSQE